MLTCQLTEKNIKSTTSTCTTLRNNYVSLTSSKCRFHEKILYLSSSLWKNGWLDLDAVWSDGSVGPRMRRSDGIGDCPARRCTKHASLISTTSNIASELSGPSWIMPSLLQLCVSGVDVFQLVWRRVVVISSTAFNSDISTVVGWYSSLIFLQLSVMTLCILIHDDRLIHKVK